MKDPKQEAAKKRYKNTMRLFACVLSGCCNLEKDLNAVAPEL